MSRLLHSLKHRHARLMVMTRACACDRNLRVCVLACACLYILCGCICYLRPPSRVIGCGKWEDFVSQPPIPRNRSMAHSSDRRQSELALTVGANERGRALWLCKEGAEPRLMQTCSVDFDALHTRARETDELFGSYWHLGEETVGREHKSVQ